MSHGAADPASRNRDPKTTAVSPLRMGSTSGAWILPMAYGRFVASDTGSRVEVRLRPPGIVRWALVAGLAFYLAWVALAAESTFAGDEVIEAVIIGFGTFVFGVAITWGGFYRKLASLEAQLRRAIEAPASPQP